MKSEGLLKFSYRVKKLLGIINIFIIIMTFAACGSSEPELLITGVFIDSAVQGLEFQSGNRAGITDSEGKFYFKTGETIKFSLGGIKIGQASPKEVMTPIDLVDEPDSFVTHPAVTNICRLLQSLDADGDPTNGIVITEAIRNGIESLGIEIDFSLDPEEFEDQAQTLLDELSSLGVFSDGDNRELVSSQQANIHFFNSLAEKKIAPVVMINLGDGLTNGAQSGFANVHRYTQAVGYAAYLSYQANTASNFIWENPLLELDENRNFTRVLVDDLIKIPYNLGVNNATAKSLIEEKTGGDNALLNELMKPIPGDSGAEVSQLEAALYVANLHPNRLKLFTLWIGAEDSIKAATINGGSELSTASIQAFLGGVAAGHDLDSVKANIAEIVNRLLEVPYSYVFIANLPHIDTIGSLFSKNDIETLATFNNPDVTVMDGNQLIGFDPFVGDYSQAETSISRALNTDNTTLNNTISNVLADDSKFLSQDEINLINQRIDQINNHIKSIADANQNVILVDMKEFYNQLIDGGIELESKTLTKTFGQGFFGLDGYYPSYSGYSLIANEFIQKINDAHIGLDMDLIDVNNNVLTVDPYSIDEDGDGFFPTPGAYPTVTSIPIFDPILEGWVDCDDNNNAVYPEFVSGEPCD